MAQFTNQASLLYNGIRTNSNIVTGEVTQVINAWKDATVDTYQAGDIITYVISLQNSGTTTITDLTITDDLGAYTFGTGTLVPLTYTGDPILYYQNGILQTPPVPIAGPPLVINNITVLPGTSAILVYRVQVNEYAPLTAGSTIENTITVSGGGLTTNPTDTDIITINANPILNIIKAINPNTIVENGEVTYTFTIQNTSTTAAEVSAGIVISDTFNPILTNLTATLNGNAWPAAGNYTYNETTGIFATIEGTITVPAATYTQDPETGIWNVIPGTTVLEVTGTI